MSVEASGAGERPKPFADLWDITGTPRPPTTVANPLGEGGRPEAPRLRSTSIGERYRRIGPDELAAVPSVDRAGGIDLSPDGAEVAFAWDRSGGLEIYTAPLVGDRIIQLTEARAHSHTPRWSPDGRWVAFLRDEEDGRRSLRLVDRDGDHERRLTAAAGPYRDPAWSPDGRRIALADERAIYAIDVATGASPRIAEGAQPRWSPDGSEVLFARDGGLFVVAARGGEPRALSVPTGSRDARWSPDGSMIAFTTAADGRSEIAFAYVRAGPRGGIVEGAVTRVERLGVTPFDGTDAVWRPDGRGVVHRRHEHGNVVLRQVFTVSHAADAVLDVRGSCGVAQIAPDSETVVAVLGDARHGADVVVRSKGAIALSRITRSLPAEIDPGVLVEPVYLADAGPALVYVPHDEAVRGARRAAVAVHAERPERDWDPTAQILANHGHAVVVTPSRGASGVARARELLRGAGLAEAISAVVPYEPSDEVPADRPAREARLRDVLSRAERGA